MKDYWKEPEAKKINHKKLLLLITIAIIAIMLTTMAIIYINNKEIRTWVDKNILQKEKMQNNLPSIEIDESESSNIYAFNKYIGVLSKNNFSIYNNAGKKENTLTLEITTPIFNSNNKHLVVAEEKGKKLYLITDKEIVWEREVEGNIAQVTVNENGYVAVTIVDTLYKTVIAMYSSEGEHLFSTFLSTTRVAATSISNDNKYLALAEIDTSGTMVQSNIKQTW